MDLGFGLLVKNCVYSRLETSGNPQFGQQLTKFSLEKLLRSHQGIDTYKGKLSNIYAGQASTMHENAAFSYLSDFPVTARKWQAMNTCLDLIEKTAWK